MVRKPVPGMGEAVAKRSFLRQDKETKVWETWEELAERLGVGNSLLHPTGGADKPLIVKWVSSGALLMSGRALQHGDVMQPHRNMEIFTNCSTAATSAIKFWLLMNGSGVGRCYDDALMVVNWNNLPHVYCVLSEHHPDYNDKVISAEAAREEFNVESNDIWFYVPDSREGWAQALELLETLAYQGNQRDRRVFLDFTPVREKDAPIAGMQDRPASGPLPLMEGIDNIARMREAFEMEVWEQTMYVDHYLAEIVVVGGARRASRIGVKFWKDKAILDFIRIKQRGNLWSSNNSVAVDKEFWDAVGDKHHPWHAEATTILREITNASYYGNPHDGTAKGEPGFVNVHKLTQKNDGMDDYLTTDFIGFEKYRLSDKMMDLYRELARLVLDHVYQYIVNPCGEIVLFILGAYCVIGDIVPAHCESIEEAIEVAKLTVRMLIRTNLLPCMYQTEVRRTNRIGVSITGMFEWAWKHYGLTFYDLLDPEKSKYFWRDVARIKRAVDVEAVRYSLEIGVTIPHTNTTIKPAGTTSKTYHLTEGAHLPGDLFILRWVLFHEDDPRVQDLTAKGYPCVPVKFQAQHVRIGFPTTLAITSMMPLAQIVTASQATIEEQYEWVRLLEKYWIHGVDEKGEPLTSNTGNQISYTLKVNPDELTYEDYHAAIVKNQNTVRTLSMMPYKPGGFEYQPEEPISFDEYMALVEQIDDPEMTQEIDVEHLKCQGGACPIL